MATVVCRATGYPQRRYFRRGYRMKEDSCAICNGPVRRCNDGDRALMEIAEEQHYCPSHACIGRNVVGQKVATESDMSDGLMVSGGAGLSTVLSKSYYTREEYVCPLGHTFFAKTNRRTEERVINHV